jgi:hypothetical protein
MVSDGPVLRKGRREGGREGGREGRAGKWMGWEGKEERWGRP